MRRTLTIQRRLKTNIALLTRWTKTFPTFERLLFWGLSGTLGIAFVLSFVFASTFRGQMIPDQGGSYTEGIIGSPRYVNPILAPANEVDRALAKLIYPSLLTPAPDGTLIVSLAKSFSVENGGKTFEFVIKENAVWEDGKPITAHDVVFTVKTIQDERIDSPLNRLWSGVVVEAEGEKTVRFTLPRPYAFFLQNATLGILPSHIWKRVTPQEFALSPYNRNPVGGGPYTLKNIEGVDGKITRALLVKNPSFFGQKSFIESIVFKFYPDSDKLFDALKNKEVDSIPITSPALYEKLKSDKDITLHSFLLPRYFAIFLNEKENKALADKTVRQALLLAIQKDAIIKEIFREQAQVVSSPIGPALRNYYRADVSGYDYNPERARTLLASAGFEKTPLHLELSVIDNDSLSAVASRIVEDWRSVGVDAILKNVNIEGLRDEALQKRAYQAFLFGHALALEPDPFSLWHSSQKNYPGLNLSSYTNNELDKLLEELRETFDKEKQKELFQNFQRILAEDLPALFLYSPHQLFAMRSSIKGVVSGVLSLPEDRFSQVAQWYINTKRVE